jgi:hypothetical protein
MAGQLRNVMFANIGIDFNLKMFRRPVVCKVQKNASLLFKATVFSEHDTEWYHYHNPPNNAYAASSQFQSPLDTTPLISSRFSQTHQSIKLQRKLAADTGKNEDSEQLSPILSFNYSLFIEASCWVAMTTWYLLVVRDIRSQSIVVDPTRWAL